MKEVDFYTLQLIDMIKEHYRCLELPEDEWDEYTDLIIKELRYGL